MVKISKDNSGYHRDNFMYNTHVKGYLVDIRIIIEPMIINNKQQQISVQDRLLDN